jgi:hypothetical protein
VAKHLECKVCVRNGYKWSIGTCHNIPLWDSRWLFDGSILTKPADIDVVIGDMKVYDILGSNVKQLDRLKDSSNSSF